MTDELLRKEFEIYGNVIFAKVVKDKNGKSRGYGFVEFGHRSDFLSAYRQATYKKILKRKIVVDAEYGRTRKGFRPTRFGGGLGLTRRSKKHSFAR